MYRKVERGSAMQQVGRLLFAVLCIPALLMPVTGLSAEEVETADALLDLERKIAIEKRIMELRELQIKRQEQDMRFFRGDMNSGSRSGPEVVRIPEIRVEMIRTYEQEMVAGLHYGKRYQVVKKGDVIDQGVKVLKVTSMGVLIDIHGSQMHFSLSHSQPSPPRGTAKP